MNATRKRSAAYLVAACATAMALIGTATSAQASGTTCSGGICVVVNGSGLHIDNMEAIYTGGADSQSSGFQGFFHFWVGDWSSTSTTQWWGYLSSLYAFPPDRQWPENTLACAQGWELQLTGNFTAIDDPACVTVHS